MYKCGQHVNGKLIMAFVAGAAAGVVATLLIGAALWPRNQTNAPMPKQTVATPPPIISSPVPSKPPSVITEIARVVINGRPLDATQIAAVKARYGVEPRPGNYWYDTRSGLFGLSGQAAVGFMYAGHDFGPLAEDASAGNTGVYLNGRNLTIAEVTILISLTGVMWQPGRYWFDAQGNVGIDGNPQALGNLYLIARARAAAGGGGGGGDNFWSSRFSAGNYNAEGQGYVSVPGIGPVGYGF